MKKIKPFHECDFSCLTKTFRIMRITLFLMLAVILKTFANEAYSQKTKLSLDYTITDRKIILAPSFLTEVAQQQRSVSGKVTDSGGQPLPGVTVVVKGTTQGTVTNADGTYTLSNIPDNAALVFSFVGMRTQEVVVGGQTTISVAMEEETIGLEEVVAVGYGTVSKRDITTSVSK